MPIAPPLPVTLNPIGLVRSPFRDKFGVPRQARLVAGVEGRIEFVPPFDRPEALERIEGFSHLWVIWIFHQSARGEWQPRVRPPRLGGNRWAGVFASRSPFRPNPLGLSVVELLGIDRAPNLALRIGGLDMVDGTPVVDIKPYIPYSDAIPDARPGYASPPEPGTRAVSFTEQARVQARRLAPQAVDLVALIEGLLRQDPRPAYQEAAGRRYGMRLYDLDVRWEERPRGPVVVAVERIGDDA